MGACVKIELGRLRARLSVEGGRELSLVDVHTWLGARGFALRGDWHCDGSALCHLRPDEVREIRTFEDADPIAYPGKAPPNPPGA